MTQRLATLLGVLVLLLSACGGAVSLPSASPLSSATASPTAAAFPATLSDFQGRSVTVNARPSRIVSIGPSITEFLFALGAGDRVVGVDEFSDEPAAAKQIDKVGGVKVNVEKVVSLKPDLVLSVKFSDGTIESLVSAGLTVLVVDPQSIADVSRTAVLVGKAVGADGSRLSSDIDAQLSSVKEKVASAATRPRVFHEVDASDPTKPFTVGPGSYIQDLITLAGGTNIAANTGSAYPQISLEEVVKDDPEIIILGDADYGTTADQVASRPGWSAISAVKNKKIFPISDSLVSRPGPRLGDAALAYAKLLHPEIFR